MMISPSIAQDPVYQAITMRMALHYQNYCRFQGNGMVRCAAVALAEYNKAVSDYEQYYDDMPSPDERESMEQAEWEADLAAERRNEAWFDERGYNTYDALLEIDGFTI